MTTPELDGFAVVRPDEGLKGAALAFRDSFYAAGEKVINGSGGLDFYPDYESWLSYLRRVESGEEEGFVPSRIYFAQAPDGRLAAVLDIRPGLPAEKSAFGHVGYATAPAFRGRGVAAGLLHWGVGELRRQGVKDLLVCCYEENTPSRRVLEKCGFTKTGSRVEAETGKIVLEYVNAL